MTGTGAQLVALCLFVVAPPAIAQIKVRSPSSLAKSFIKGRIEGATSAIGAPFYGDRVLGQLVYGESSGSSPYCTKEDYDLPDPRKAAAQDVKTITIAMVRRGGCSFATKVRVAAEKGAHAVIIVDKPDSTLTRTDMNKVVVGEEPYADDVHIPSIFVCKQDGQRLIEEYKRQQAKETPTPILVELAWDVPTSAVVIVDQWMSSASGESLKFLKEFAKVRRALNQVLKFKPHYSIFSIGSGGSAQSTSRLCTDSTGKFCAEDPDGDGRVDGKDVIGEDLRQLCLHRTTKVSSDAWVRDEHNNVKPEYAAKYWSYIELFAQRCPLNGAEPVKQFGPDCSYALMREVGVTEAELQQIMLCADPARNELELQRQLQQTAWSPRALRINGWRYSGILDPELVATAVCQGFIEEPLECAQVKVWNRNNWKPYVPIFQRSGSSISFSTMIAWILVSVAVAGGAFFLYKRYMTKQIRFTIREEVMLEVEARMGAYGKMQD